MARTLQVIDLLRRLMIYQSQPHKHSTRRETLPPAKPKVQLVIVLCLCLRIGG